MDFLEQGLSPDMEKAYNAFIAQRMVDEENQTGKVDKRWTITQRLVK